MQQKQEFGWCRLILYILSALAAFWIANAVSPVTDGILDAVIAALVFIALLMLFWWLSRKICGMLGSKGTTGAVAGAAGIASASASGVKDRATGAASAAADTVKGASSSIKDGATDVAGAAADTAQGAASAIADGAGATATATAGAVTSAKDTVVDAVVGNKDASIDFDGDGVADTLDVDGDGVADVDLAADGSVHLDADAAVGGSVDVDGDGIADGVAIDTDGDGKVDAVDLDGDGKADAKASVVSDERISETKHISEMTDDERVAARAQAGLLTEAREGGPDDLKKIKGVGPKFEGLMHEIGVFHFDQIAKWTAADIQFVDDHLTAFKGRIVRDDWVGQAKILASGGETAFSNKVDKGGVY